MRIFRRGDIAQYEDRIRSAYAHLAGAPGDLVPLADLRPQVGGHRELVDEALISLSRQPGVVLLPESNQKTLTGWDRVCAVEVGDQFKHHIGIR